MFIANSNTATGKNTSKLDYLLVLLLICMSGNPAFTVAGRLELLLVLVLCFLGALLLWHRKARPTSMFVIVVAVFCAIFAIQSISFDYIQYVTIAGFFTRLFIGYAVLRLVKEFPSVYIKVMFYIALLSLCFYVPDQICQTLGLDFKSFFEPIRVAEIEGDFHIFIHNFGTETDTYRNYAFFWEPGAFAAYIVLAIMLLGLLKHEYQTQQYGKLLAVLCITLLTTFSTTGYVLLPLCLLLHADLSNIPLRKVPQLLLVLVVVIGLAVCFYRLDFVGAKIEHQYTQATLQRGSWQKTRIGTVLFDMDYIKRRPFFGWGLHEKTRFALDGGETVTGQGNGLTDFTCKFGLFGLATYLVCIWKGGFKLTKSNRLKTTLFMLLILLVLNGEGLLNYPLFLGLMFLAGMSPTNTHRFSRFHKRKTDTFASTERIPIWRKNLSVL